MSIPTFLYYNDAEELGKICLYIAIGLSMLVILFKICTMLKDNFSIRYSCIIEFWVIFLYIVIMLKTSSYFDRDLLIHSDNFFVISVLVLIPLSAIVGLYNVLKMDMFLYIGLYMVGLISTSSYIYYNFGEPIGKICFLVAIGLTLIALLYKLYIKQIVYNIIRRYRYQQECLTLERDVLAQIKNE